MAGRFFTVWTSREAPPCILTLNCSFILCIVGKLIVYVDTSLDSCSFFFFFWIGLLQWWDYPFSCSAVSNSLWAHGMQHTRLPCPSLTPRACSNSCLSSRWCHPIISSSVVPFCSCSQSFPASGSFPMRQFFALGGQSIGVSASASVPPMNIQDWSLVGKLSSHKHQGRGKKQMKERNNNNNSNTFTWRLDGELYGGGIGLILRERLRL